MADEAAICADFLYKRLNVTTVINALGTASRIYDTDVPQNPITGQTAIFPCVTYHQQASSDTFGVGAVRIFVRSVWTVKVIVDDQTFKEAAVIFSIVDAAVRAETRIAHGSAPSILGYLRTK